MGEVVWIIDISKENPKMASIPRRGIKCSKCGHVNPLVAKFCIECGAYLDNKFREKHDKLIREIYEDIKKSHRERDYVDLDDIQC